MIRCKLTIHRILYSIAIVAAVLVVYFGTFFYSVREMSVTLSESSTAGGTRFRTVFIYYFSADEDLNAKMYWLFYPLHYWLSGHDLAVLDHRLQTYAGKNDPPVARRYFLKDFSVLKRAGITIRRWPAS